MKRPKKRYYTDEQILAQIDKTVALIKELQELATKAQHDVMYSEIGRIDEVHRLRTKAGNLQHRTLVKLSEKLAELRTQTLPGILEDGSVPASTR